MNHILVNQNRNKMVTQNLVLIITAISTGLIAGLFYAYSCSVNPGLGKLSGEGYLAAMQSINREILNPVFFASFMGTLIFLPVSTWMQYRAGVSTTFWLLLAATLLYAIGTFGVTMFGNVPLNDALDKFSLQGASGEEITRHRAQFEIPWNRLHTVRTVASVAALALVIIACVNRSAVYESGK
jgi:uncharacterized membrane protein